MPTQRISSHFLRHHFTWIYTLMPSHKIFLELPWKNYIQQGGKFQNERIIKNFLSAVTCKRYTSKISWWTNNVFFSPLILTNCLLVCLLLGCSVFIWPIIEDWCSAAAESFPEIHFLSLFSLGKAAIGLRTHHTSLDLKFNIWTPAIGNLGLTFQTKSSAQY